MLPDHFLVFFFEAISPIKSTADKSDFAESAPQVSMSSSDPGAPKSGSAATSGPEGQYLKAVRMGDIKVEPRLRPNKY